jgi:voltage-gated potassium channel Kch
MTTLGYGDVVPLTRQAQGVAIGAAVTGQLFMAVLIGRLVGSYLAKPAPRRKRGRSRRRAR